MLLCLAVLLYLIEILHQTTTAAITWLFVCSCILSKFYIKPQRRFFWSRSWSSCILSKFYIKPQLKRNPNMITQSCILSKFYIKPQQQRSLAFSYVVVSYRNSTSNHNHIDTVRVDYMLYLIEILHQTTTAQFVDRLHDRLYLIEILHQTTTALLR